MSVRLAAVVAFAGLATLSPALASAATAESWPSAWPSGPFAAPVLPMAASDSPAAAAAAAVKAQIDPTVGFDGPVHTMAYAGDRIYVAGDFTHAIGRDGQRVARTRLAAVDARTGNLLSWSPTANGAVRSIAPSDWGVFIGGDFTTVNGLKRDSIAQLDPASGAVTTFSHTVYGHPHAVAAASGRLYVGGTMTSVDGRTVGKLVAFDLATGKLDTSWLPSANGTVETILPTTAGVFLGGGFDRINGVKGTAHVASVDARGAVLPFRTSVPDTVFSLTVSNNTLYAGVDGSGGRATAIDAVSGAVRWQVTTDGDVRAVVRVNNMVYIGGHFDRTCRSNRVGDHGVCLDGSERRIKLFAVDAASGALLNWLADADGVVGVEALAANPGLGKVAAGGQFKTINGVAQPRFAQFRAP